MASSRKPRRVPIYFRITPEAEKRIKQFLADYAGKPLYVKPGEWAESVLLKAIDDIEAQYGEPGPVSAAGRDRSVGRGMSTIPINSRGGRR